MELSVESPCYNVKWKVQHFFQLPSRIGYFLNSPSFDIAGDSYCLRLYPNGTPYWQRYQDQGLGAVTEISLVRLTSTFPERKVSCNLGYKERYEDGYELDNYISLRCNKLNLRRSPIEVMRDTVVPGDTFTVLCSIALREQSSGASPQSEEVKTTDAEKEQELLPGVAKLKSDYKRLLQKGAESDVCLVVSGKEFRAHRLVLRTRSEVFDAMFSHETAEKESGQVVIEDLDPDSFEEFLEYLYTGGVEAGFTDENAFWLYAAAEKYDVSTLRSECVAHMRRTLSVDSFCDVVTLALRHREEDLMQHAIQFFKKNMARIIVTVKWQQFVIDNGTSANELLIKAIVPGEK